MTIEIFGKGDLVAIPAQNALLGTVSPDCAYTHPSLESCYSRYGFAYPLDRKGMPLGRLLSDKLPITTDFIKGDLECHYMLIDHHEQMWRLHFTWSDTDVKGIEHVFIDHQNNGWWIGLSPGVEVDELRDIHALQGFLYANPTTKKINQYCRAYWGNKDLEWLSVKNIVNRLNKDYPLKGNVK